MDVAVASVKLVTAYEVIRSCTNGRLLSYGTLYYVPRDTGTFEKLVPTDTGVTWDGNMGGGECPSHNIWYKEEQFLLATGLKRS